MQRYRELMCAEQFSAWWRKQQFLCTSILFPAHAKHMPTCCRLASLPSLILVRVNIVTISNKARKYVLGFSGSHCPYIVFTITIVWMDRVDR